MWSSGRQRKRFAAEARSIQRCERVLRDGVRGSRKLGDRVSDWNASHPTCELAEVVVTRARDAGFHCIAITAFYLAA